MASLWKRQVMYGGYLAVSERFSGDSFANIQISSGKSNLLGLSICIISKKKILKDIIICT